MYNNMVLLLRNYRALNKHQNKNVTLNGDVAFGSNSTVMILTPMDQLPSVTLKLNTYNFTSLNATNESLAGQLRSSLHK